MNLIVSLISLLLFLIFSIGGLYEIFGEDFLNLSDDSWISEGLAGSFFIALGVLIPLAILKIVKWDKEQILDFFAFAFNTLWFLAILVIYILVEEITRLIFQSTGITILILVIGIVSLFESYRIADHRKYRWGSFLLITGVLLTFISINILVAEGLI